MIDYRITFHRFARSEHFQSTELLSIDALLHQAEQIYNRTEYASSVSDFTIYIENPTTGHDAIALQGDIHRERVGGDLIFSALS